ncbi:MAG: hypothetical protein COB85_03405 [Bacteroidetes bacterium]|nr:MAG: hypothetical protein COB85_03405 [Bacteroidota bacterium]
MITLLSCNPTRRLSSDENLLVKNVIVKKYHSGTELKSKKRGRLKNDESSNYLRQKPNTKMLKLFRFHLWVYNIAASKNLPDEDKAKNKKRNKKKSKTKKIKNIVGEAPVVVDSNLAAKSARQIEIYLNSKGFLNASVRDSIAYRKKRKKRGGGKCVAYYLADYGPRFKINSIKYKIEESNIAFHVRSDSSNFSLKEGMFFDRDKLDKDRDVIAHTLRNNGYYFFSKDNIFFEADSSVGNQLIDIKLGIKKRQEYNSKDSLIETDHIRYKINKILIQSHFIRNLESPIFDTLLFQDYLFVENVNNLKKEDRSKYIKYQTITRKVFLKPGNLFKIDDLQSTYQHLARLHIYKFINITFNISDKPGFLDCFIQLSPVTRQSFSIETEGTHSSGDLGIGANLIYRNKNTFKGAELLEIKFKGALEAQKTLISTSESVEPLDVFNTYEVGPETKIYIPKFVFPIISKKIPKRYDPKTTFSIAYNYQHRADYTRTIAKGSYAYEWKESIFKTHILSPIGVNLVSIDPNSPILATLSTIKNDFVRNSFIDHFTSSSRYSFIYNNQTLNRIVSFTYFRVNIEAAGNTLRALSKAFNAPLDTATGNYELFSIQFSQYVLIDFDFRRYSVINEHTKLVSRFAAGLGLPYGNSTVMPFEKSYFAGGANGLRGWQARDLGPGSFVGPNNFDQIGDIRLEANLETRFEIISIFEGAAFVDAGNIWLTQEDEERPGALFEFEDFLSEIAVDAGLGLRLNFNFFIIRLDAAVPVTSPSNAYGKRWVLGNSKTEDINYNIGIGYPF